MIDEEFEGGKYRVTFDDAGRLAATRHGEPWRDLVGDKLVLSMLQEVERLRAGEGGDRMHMRQYPTIAEWEQSQMNPRVTGDYLQGVRDFVNWKAEQLVTRLRCHKCRDLVYEQWVVHDAVWLSVMPSKDGLLHARCFEAMLGRKLSLQDLRPDLELNAPYFAFGGR